MKGAERVRWFSFGSPGEEWTVWLASWSWMQAVARASGDSHLLGYCDESQREVLVCASQGREEQDETLFHEVIHSAAGTSLGAMPIEEGIVSTLSPPLWRRLREIGFRWPRRPRGAARIERLARRQAEDNG